MIATAEIIYLGSLRTQSTHMASGTVIETDAPIDNNGKGEKFSPTDLLASSYASCMLTIIGIYCKEHGYKFENGIAKVTKIMAASPRRVGKLVLKFDLSNNGWTKQVSDKIIRAAKACPVAKSLNNEVEIEFSFHVQ